jgi:N-acetylglucosamine-6-phosphate deacetylase
MQTCAALSAGATYATHLFNAMRGISQREPGATTALLLAEKVFAELIVDGIHLHGAIVELCLRVKTKDVLLLVSDAMRAKCLGEGQFDLGGQQVQVAQGKAALADGTLAGTILTIPEAIQNIIAFTHCTLIDAVQMASENPARVLQLNTRKGSIAKGKDADLVILDANYNVKLTMREGNVIFKA